MKEQTEKAGREEQRRLADALAARLREGDESAFDELVRMFQRPIFNLAYRMLNQYEDDATPDWLYTWALLAFRRRGDSREARNRLQEAQKWNPHVPAFLLGRKRLPRRLPDTITFGGESEAISYAAEFGESWRRTEGALEWLASMEATG